MVFTLLSRLCYPSSHEAARAGAARSSVGGRARRRRFERGAGALAGRGGAASARPRRAPVPRLLRRRAGGVRARRPRHRSPAGQGVPGDLAAQRADGICLLGQRAAGLVSHPAALRDDLSGPAAPPHLLLVPGRAPGRRRRDAAGGLSQGASGARSGGARSASSTAASGSCATTAAPAAAALDPVQLKRWDEMFLTTDRATVEENCRDEGFTPTWLPGGRLRLVSEQPALRSHPETGEPVWHNHVQVFHAGTGAAEYRRIFGERRNLRSLRALAAGARPRDRRAALQEERRARPALHLRRWARDSRRRSRASARRHLAPHGSLPLAGRRRGGHRQLRRVTRPYALSRPAPDRRRLVLSQFAQSLLRLRRFA